MIEKIRWMCLGIALALAVVAYGTAANAEDGDDLPHGMQVETTSVTVTEAVEVSLDVEAEVTPTETEVRVKTDGDYVGGAPALFLSGCQGGLSLGGTFGGGGIGGESAACQKLRVSLALRAAGHDLLADDLLMEAYALTNDDHNPVQAVFSWCYRWIVKPPLSLIPLVNRTL